MNKIMEDTQTIDEMFNVYKKTYMGKDDKDKYKENLSQCLKSKRVADREVNGERVIFSCKVVKGLLQEDKQAKYGIRLLKVLD